MHRPGIGTLHKGPDGISRHPEGRDRLILARTSEWEKFRNTIKGVDDGIEAGEFDDDDPLTVEISSVPEEKASACRKKMMCKPKEGEQKP